MFLFFLLALSEGGVCSCAIDFAAHAHRTAVRNSAKGRTSLDPHAQREEGISRVEGESMHRESWVCLHNASLCVNCLHLSSRCAGHMVLADICSDITIQSCLLAATGMGTDSSFVVSGGVSHIVNITLPATSTTCRLPSLLAPMGQQPAAPMPGKAAAVSSCSFGAFELSSSSPFISANNGQSCFVDGCSFSNITGCASATTCAVCTGAHEHMANTRIEGVASPMQGTLVWGTQNHGGFCVANTSFVRCTTKHIQPERVETSGSEPISFTNTLFDSFSGDNGGAILHSVNCTLSITECDFVRCSCKNVGGAIQISSNVTTQTIINSSRGIECSSQGYAGFLFSDYNLGLVVSKSNFSLCECVNTGGCLYLNRVPKNVMISQCEILSCTETQGMPSLSGGGILIGDGTNITITDCKLFNCTAAYGGGIDFCGDGNYGGAWTASVRFCYFELNTARLGAKDISFRKNWVGKVSAGMVVECRSMSSGGRLVMIGEDDVSSEWIWTGFFEGIRVSGAEGIDHQACGLNQRKCRTLAYAVSVVDSTRAAPSLVSVDSSTYVETNCVCGTAHIELAKSGSGEEVVVVSSISDGSLFSVSTGSLKLTSFGILHNTAKSSPATSLFALTSTGTLQLHNCSISPDPDHSADTPLRSPLFTLCGGSTLINTTTLAHFWTHSSAALAFTSECTLSVIHSALSGVARLSGGGGGMEGCVGGGHSLTIEEAELSGCCVDESSCAGGGVWMKLDEVDVEYLVKNTAFSGNRAQMGRDVFVVTDSPRDALVNERWAGSVREGEDEADKWVVDAEADPHISRSVLYFLFPPQLPTVLVKSGGSADPRCGDDLDPCGDVVYGLGRMRPDQTTLCILDSCALHETMGRGGLSLTICGQSAASPSLFVLGADGQLTVQTAGTGPATLVLSSLCFDLPPSSAAGHMVSVEGGVLSLNGCSFGGEAERRREAGLWIARGRGGAVRLAKVHIAHLSFPADSGVVSMDGGSVEVAASDWTSTEAEGPLVCAEGCEKAEVADGCCFDCCRSRAPEGGIVKCTLLAAGALVLANSTITNSGITGGGGRGGGIHASLPEGSTSNYLVEATSFGSNCAQCGRDLFLVCDDLNDTLCPSKFLMPLATPSGEKSIDMMGCDRHRFQQPSLDLYLFLVQRHAPEVSVASTGYDMAGCGSEQHPCATFWKAVGQLDRSVEAASLLVGDSATLCNSFDLSNCSVAGMAAPAEPESDPESESESDPESGETTPAAKLVLKKPEADSMSNGLARNSGHLSFASVCMVLDHTLADAAGIAVCSAAGELCIAGCVLSAGTAGVRFADLKFVAVLGGALHVTGLEASGLSFGEAVFEWQRGCSCVLQSVVLADITASRGVIRQLGDGPQGRNEAPALEVNGSSFERVTAGGGEASVFVDTPAGSAALLVNESVFEACRSDRSERGGMMLFVLGEAGALDVSSSRIRGCQCSQGAGKGGGVYVKAEGQGALDFVFRGVVFSGNSAWKGRDVFVECVSIAAQISESQFRLDLRPDVYNRFDAIFGSDATHAAPVDLMDYVTIYQQSTIVVSTQPGSGGADGRQCGKVDAPCRTVPHALQHLIADCASRLLIRTSSTIDTQCSFANLEVNSVARAMASVSIAPRLPPTQHTQQSVVCVSGRVVVENVCFALPADLPSHSSLVCADRSANASFVGCEFRGEGGEGGEGGAGGTGSSASLPTLLLCAESEVRLEEVRVDSVRCTSIVQCTEGRVAVRRLVVQAVSTTRCALMMADACSSAEGLEASDCAIEHGSFVEVANSGGAEADGADRRSFACSLASLANISSADAASCFRCSMGGGALRLSNCTLSGCLSAGASLGSLALLAHSPAAALSSCVFEGTAAGQSEHSQPGNTGRDELCAWNTSLVAFANCTATLSDTTVSHSPLGGIAAAASSIAMADARMFANSPAAPHYPSARRNILCTGPGTLAIASLKGGDGTPDAPSLWIRNEGCRLAGIIPDRPSPFFVPVLSSAAAQEDGSHMALTLRGALLLPCSLAFRLVTSADGVDVVDSHEFADDGYVSESEARGRVPLATFASAPPSAEISVAVLFGGADGALCATPPLVLKNRSEPASAAHPAEAAAPALPSWLVLLLVAFGLLFLAALAVSVAATVRWRKQKRRTEELEVIVNDNIRKDPKAFEMVTMEMSPEEQWRRAEREAEKKNEERFKKRVYENSLGHSESSEHLLSESGSTEYILGKDSDKIPDWALEKVEEEETRKRTPSPSISSISSTSTTDSDSTFVRSESLCPTTSSMSNLVDAMACSSPHEKLIVDLRDSLFMLLHGRNEKKEMAIGTLEEREMTAAQILFWVANLALHSFDEMENGLSSLANLSPHIVLFSEHMVICIALHSDCSSSDDSDSSSISSSTVVTSASDDDDDDDDRDSLPSSAFEDADDNWKECLRWKAPELQMSKKMGATKESVAFSIGMMLWECLALQIPFGEYPAEVAGQKIANGERPRLGAAGGSTLLDAVRMCLEHDPGSRPSLVQAKRELIQRFPKGAAVPTASDAITLGCQSQPPSTAASSDLLEPSGQTTLR